MSTIFICKPCSFDQINSYRNGEQSKIYRIVLRRNIDFKDEFFIAPHINECWCSIELLRLHIGCHKQDKKLIAYGTVNQFPLLSVFADEVILVESNHYNWYGKEGNNSRIHCPCEPIQHLIDKKFLTPRVFFWKEWLKPPLQNLIQDVSDEEVVEQFADPKVWIRQESLDYFNNIKSNLPSNIYYFDCKYNKTIDLHREKFKRYNLDRASYGLDFEQQELLNKAKDHYMTVQFLASWFNNWIFFTMSGASAIFNVLPVRWAGGWCDSTGPQVNRRVINRIAKLRFGVETTAYPIPDQLVKIASKLDKVWDWEILEKSNFNKSSLMI